MAIVLADLLDPKQVKLDMQAQSAQEAIRELVGILAANGRVPEPKKLSEAVIQREHENPSTVEDGVAFPHARTDVVETIVLAIGRSQAGIQFWRNPAAAHLLFLIGVPKRLVGDYLVCVGALARIARNATFRDQLMAATTPEDFIGVLRHAASPEGGTI